MMVGLAAASFSVENPRYGAAPRQQQAVTMLDMGAHVCHQKGAISAPFRSQQVAAGAVHLRLLILGRAALQQHRRPCCWLVCTCAMRRPAHGRVPDMQPQDTASPCPCPGTLLKLRQYTPHGAAKLLALHNPGLGQTLVEQDSQQPRALRPALCDAVSPTRNSLCCPAVSCVQARDQAAALRATSRWVTAPACQALDAATVEGLLLGASSRAEQVGCRRRREALCSKLSEQKPSAGPVGMLGSAAGIACMGSAVKTVADTWAVQQRHNWGTNRKLHLVHWSVCRLHNQVR